MSIPSFVVTAMLLATPALAARPKAARLSAAQIVKKHVAARGGLAAWRSVQTLVLSGKIDAGTGDSIARSVRVARGPGAVTTKMRREIAAAGVRQQPDKQVQLPFTLTRERPNKSRLEIEFAGKTAVQVYDGTSGWKVRPFLNRNEVEPFKPEEAKIEADADMGDPLLDAGARAELEAVEKLEGRDAYKLKVTTGGGTVKRIWIDAKTFLDVKVEGVPRRMDGRTRSVWVYQRDFRSIQGVKMPFLLETVVDGSPQPHRIVIEKAAVNAKLGASTFAKPRVG